MSETVWAGYHVSLGVARIARTARDGWSLCGVSVAAVCDVWVRARAREGGGGRLARDGDASGHAGICATSRVMGNRHAIGTGWSLIIRSAPTSRNREIASSSPCSSSSMSEK